MLDIKRIKENPDAIKAGMKAKEVDCDATIDLVQKIRNKIPDVSLTTDIMVGFPGETEEDFNEVLSLMNSILYENAFMYYYNLRDGTPADVFRHIVAAVFCRVDFYVFLIDSLWKGYSDVAFLYGRLPFRRQQIHIKQI